ncbi:MAG: prepilin-type N-terminal cleavage/methylation domain-containing protein [Deltaproteobacteria bacterium]|nr:prepilin-type N-terminal cleavage/methylation domain-containing protein [Deltaproteobacteria bacterium]
MTLRTHHRAARGFTLIELMIALAIGSFGLAAAANVVHWATRKSGQGEQKTDVTSRARIISQQLRQDAQLAGYGSSGAIANRCGVGAWAGGQMASLCVTSVQGHNAVPAVRGFDNVPVGTTFGGNTVKVGTDILELVVPNPATAVPTIADMAGGVGGQTLSLDNGALAHPNYLSLLACLNATGMIYIVDNGGANGVGRAYLGRATPTLLTSAGTVVMNGTDTLATNLGSFNIPRGSTVMCGRVSVYWVDLNDVFHRTDLRTAGFGASVYRDDGNSVGVVWTAPASFGADVIASGVEDFQVAYGVSAFVNTVTPGAASATGNFNFGGVNLNPTAGNALANDRNWFEIRTIRFSILMRGLRAVEEVKSAAASYMSAGMVQPLMENQPTAHRVPIQFQPTLVNGASDLPNLRYYDDLAEEFLAPEPL